MREYAARRAAAALLFGEPEAEALADRLADAALLAPAFLPFELASIALKKVRAAPESEAVILNNLALHRRMDLEVVAVDHEAVVALARERERTTYGAGYLWLYVRLGADDLVTLDAKLTAGVGA